MKIIAVTNRKGGVGKTTMAVHIAAGLATQGYRVGLVDTDSQGHAGVMFGLEKEDGLFNVMIEKTPIEDCVLRVDPAQYTTPDQPARGELYLLPSSKRTHRIPYMLDDDDALIFLEMLEAFGDLVQLDCILIDTQPTMSMFDGALYLAADGYVYVTECERLSFDGVEEIVEQVQRFARRRKTYLGRDTKLIGIIPNKMRADTRLHRHNISQLSNAFPGLVWSPVILHILWAEATNANELIYTYAPSGSEARDVWDIVESVETRLREWMTDEIS